MRYFGMPGMGALYKDPPAPTPVGELCLYCDRPIREGNRGYLLPPVDGYEPAVHRACMFRWIRPDLDD